MTTIMKLHKYLIKQVLVAFLPANNIAENQKNLLKENLKCYCTKKFRQRKQAIY